MDSGAHILNAGKKQMDLLAKRLVWILQRLAGLLFAGLFLVTVLNIALRNLGGITWLWIPGISRLLFIWTVFLGTASLYETEDHLIMDFLVNKMKESRRRKLNLVINCIFLAFSLILVIYGFIVVRVRMGIPFETWNFPTAYAYLAVPVSGVIMVFFCINKLRKLVKGAVYEQRV